MVPVLKQPKPAHTFESEDGGQILPLSFFEAAILHEFKVFRAFTWRDWSASLIPGMMYAITAIRCLPSPLSTAFIALGIGRALIYLVLYLYSYNLSNQIAGVAEDSINKPDRPLPSGRVSLRGAYVRLYASIVAFLVIGAAWGVMRWTILWLLLSIAENFTGLGKHWFTRNTVFISAGTVCLLQPMWELFAPSRPREWNWVLILSSLCGTLANVQDFRDVEGDRATGRHTLPLAFGDRNSRRIMAVLFCMTPLFCWVVEFTSGYHAYGFGLVMIYLAYRILRGGSKVYDDETYTVSNSSVPQSGL
ncbi:UbiA prenyltransferase family-domain-containing protein [Mycena albidolilacea]|uniref:UbiA prenyltransferase family-domain-containing protein n=1 Tax=Mycena albidolilacea TaxID=1033008 RepID=A0AAD6Z0Q6_9AGAR|nr:UbiA prenyltransferase family-domain-containing protein [Mycena albidolilacea]